MDNQTGEILNLLKTLADESRIVLLRLLWQREYNVGDLTECMSLSEPTISHHLSHLCEAGLVSLRTDGNQRFYRANEDGLIHFKRLVADTEQSPELPQPAILEDEWIRALGWPEEERKVLGDLMKIWKIDASANGKGKWRFFFAGWLHCFSHLSSTAKRR